MSIFSRQSVVGSSERLSQDEFIVLMAQYERRVRGFVATLVRQHADIDEIVQQTWLTAWKKTEEFHRNEGTLARDFVRWLCTIARFEALAFVRRHSGSRLLFDSELVGKLADVQLRDGSVLEDRRQALADCIQKLSVNQKELVRRYYRAEESAATIARQEGVTNQAIFKRLRSIRVALLECVGRTLRANEAS